MSVRDDFDIAQVRVQKLKKRTSDADLLKLYALYKQGSFGDVTGTRPGLMEVKARKKYDAWKSVEGLTKKEAMQQYIAFVEELIVRRELAVNFVHHNDAYDSYGSLPRWARDTLDDHGDDEREHVYTRSALEAAETHDRYWNAAMREMVHTGFMHNYMRMYWGKKLLEWSETPAVAFQTALALNNRYFLDGRDPSSYANVAWCFGLHDRGWTERPIFGKVRYMNAAGLRRKFDIEAYVRHVDGLQQHGKRANQ